MVDEDIWEQILDSGLWFYLFFPPIPLRSPLGKESSHKKF